MFVEQGDNPRPPSPQRLIEVVTAHWPRTSVRDMEGQINIQVRPVESPFDVDYLDPIIGCDGTDGQCAELATILQPLYPEDARVWILSKDAARGVLLRPNMSREDALSRNWVRYNGP